MYNCPICNQNFARWPLVKEHMAKKHKIKYKEYYDTHIKKLEDGVCKLCGAQTRWTGNEYNKLCGYCGRSQSLESFIVRYGIEEGTRRYNDFLINKSMSEANLIKRHGIEEGTRRYKKWKSNVGAKSLDWYINKYGEEEGTRRYNEINQTRAHNLDFYINKYGEEEGTRRYNNTCENLKWNKSSLIEKYGEEEGILKYNERCDIFKGRYTLEWFIEKYGEEEGKRRYSSYYLNFSTKLEKFIIQYGEEAGLEKYYEVRSRKVITLENLIIKYGEEEGLEKYLNWKESFLGRYTLEWFIEKYGEEEGKRRRKLFIKNSAPTKSNFIKKYGEEEGLKRYTLFSANNAQSKEKFISIYGEEEGTKRCEKWLFNVRSRGTQQASNESMEIFFPLIDWLLDEEICTLDEIYVGLPDKKEWYISGKNNIFYRYDFTIPKLKIIIEYNGESFHPNPRWLEEDTERWNTWECAFSKESAEEKYYFDRTKINFAKKHGFQIIEVWSSDEDPIDICKVFITENL